MLRKLSIILALGSALAIPSAAMARGGGRGGGGFHGGGFGGGFHGGGFGGGFHGGGLGGSMAVGWPVPRPRFRSRLWLRRFGGYGGYGGWGDWGDDWWPYYDYGDYYGYPCYGYPYYNCPYYGNQTIYYVRRHHYASRCHEVRHSIRHHGERYWRTVRVCHR